MLETKVYDMTDARQPPRDTGSASDEVADARWLADLIMALQDHAESVGRPDVAQALALAREAAEAIANGRHGAGTVN